MTMVTVLMMNMRLPSKFPPAIFPPAIFTPGQVQLVAHWMISVFIFGFRFYDDHPRTQLTERQGPGMYFTRWELRGGIKNMKLFFFSLSERGGERLAESKISLSEKTKIFLDFFCKRGMGSHLFQKGFNIKYHKTRFFSYKIRFFGNFFFEREGGPTYSKRVLS